MFSVEVLLENELPVAREEQPVHLRRMDGVDRRRRELADELLDRLPGDAGLFEVAGRPAVLSGARRAVRVRGLGGAARIEVARLSGGYADEVVGASPGRNPDRQQAFPVGALGENSRLP